MWCAKKCWSRKGLTVIIIRRELLGKAQAICPSVFLIMTISQPPIPVLIHRLLTVSILQGLVYKWLLTESGLAAIRDKE